MLLLSWCLHGSKEGLHVMHLQKMYNVRNICKIARIFVFYTVEPAESATFIRDPSAKESQSETFPVNFTIYEPRHMITNNVVF